MHSLFWCEHVKILDCLRNTVMSESAEVLNLIYPGCILIIFTVLYLCIRCEPE